MPLVMETRPAAYSVIIDDSRILLSHYSTVVELGRRVSGWTLPGGGMEVGEQPADTAVREAYEETGYSIEVEGLLGVHTGYYHRDKAPVFCAHRTIYRARIIGGELTPEEEGSTDDVRWVPLSQLPSLLGKNNLFFNALATMMGFESLTAWAEHGGEGR